MKQLVSFLLFSLVISFFSVQAQDMDSLLLWENGAPGAHGTQKTDQPRIYCYPAPADNATGSAVVVCPGGGYSHLAMDKEGHKLAKWFNKLGIGAYVLQYRLGSNDYHHPIQMNDGKRAIRIVRAHAEEWEINPDKIGVMGFSAGGHLAATLGTHFDNGMEGADDPIDKVSSKPNFMMLIYPVITLEEPYTHKGSRDYLLGNDQDSTKIKLLSNEKQITSETPPAFLVSTNEDNAVPAENSVYFYLGLRKAGVPAELHIYEKGHHGLGMGPEDMAFHSWLERCSAWLKVHEIR